MPGTVAACLALLPALLTLLNLGAFRPPPRRVRDGLAVSAIIPARDEAGAIGACLDALRASRDVALEIIVVDDGSRDATAAIVRAHAAGDARVRLLPAPALPPGWSGKQHANAVGAAVARHPVLLFLDADVRLAPDAAARLAEALARGRAALISGFPRERTEGVGEALLVPLIHVLLLGYLPVALARRLCAPSLGAGCGQLFAADAAAYVCAGGHAAIRASWHDGLTLPRAFRRAGYMTDIADASGLADCRIYAGFAAAWRGFGKNADEGMATPRALPVWTVLLGGGLVLPFALLPLGALLLLALQWSVLLGRVRGRRQVWRGRPQVPA